MNTISVIETLGRKWYNCRDKMEKAKGDFRFKTLERERKIIMPREFHRLEQQNNDYFITNTRNFIPQAISNDLVKQAFEFAYQMTFGSNGEHRNYRSGGTHQRRNGEIFANTFQGKLAEFALSSTLKAHNIAVSEPDLSVWGLGEWDSVDLEVNGKSISVKSTKSFGNLLLLEEDDWDNEAKYTPNEKSYDYTFLIRLNPYCEDLLKRKRLLYSDNVDKNILYDIVCSEQWEFDIPGYVTRDDLISVIRGGYILPRNAMLNGKTKMDASNYYVQAGDMRSISELISNLEG